MIQLPRDVHTIIQTLEGAGYEAYAVGGCVRDSLLGREPDDWDITTSAKPQEVKGLFRRTVDTGIQHGTVTIMMGEEGYEVTTYRIDGEYGDGRHPDSVSFTTSLEEDLMRRDFTINAMAYSERTGIVDLYGGREDLRQGIIRCVGDAMQRFSEDALRMMRAIRFSAQLGFTIDPATKEAILALHETLSKVSAERIQIELLKTLLSPHPDYIRLMYETGLTHIFFPEFDVCMTCEQNNPHHKYTVGEHTLKTLQHIRKDRYLRLAMLLHDIAKPIKKTTGEDGVDHFHGHPDLSGQMAITILKRLKFDNDTIHMVSRLCKYHDRGIEPNGIALRRAMHKIGPDLFPGLFEVKEADVAGQSDYKKEEKLAILIELRKCYEEVLSRSECVSLKELKIGGSDLIALGMKPGREVGNLLEQLLLEVVEEPSRNDKDALLARAKEILEKEDRT